MKRHWTEAERAAQSARVKDRMADPALRAKISERTKAGIASAACDALPELIVILRPASSVTAVPEA